MGISLFKSFSTSNGVFPAEKPSRSEERRVGKELHEVTGDDIQNFLQANLARENAEGKQEGQAKRTQARKISALRTFFKYVGMEHGGELRKKSPEWHNPTAGLDTPKISRPFI